MGGPIPPIILTNNEIDGSPVVVNDAVDPPQELFGHWGIRVDDYHYSATSNRFNNCLESVLTVEHSYSGGLMAGSLIEGNQMLTADTRDPAIASSDVSGISER